MRCSFVRAREQISPDITVLAHSVKGMAERLHEIKVGLKASPLQSSEIVGLGTRLRDKRPDRRTLPLLPDLQSQLASLRPIASHQDGQPGCGTHNKSGRVLRRQRQQTD
jgi:hypothetical protein